MFRVAFAFLDIPEIRRHISLPEFVHHHSHRGTHDGQETGMCARSVMMELWDLTNLWHEKPFFQG
jgi:hypothetical protein